MRRAFACSRIIYPRVFAPYRKSASGTYSRTDATAFSDPAIDSGKIAVGFPEFPDSRADCTFLTSSLYNGCSRGHRLFLSALLGENGKSRHARLALEIDRSVDTADLHFRV